MRVFDFTLAALAAAAFVSFAVWMVNATPDINLRSNNGVIAAKDAIVPQ